MNILLDGDRNGRFNSFTPEVVGRAITIGGVMADCKSVPTW